MSQADNYRVKTKEENFKIAERLVKTHKKDTENEAITDKVKKFEDLSSNQTNNKIDDQIISDADSLGSVENFFEYEGVSYKFQVDLINEDESKDLYSVKQKIVKIEFNDVKCIICKINLAHPFFNRFEQFKKANDYEPIIEIFKSYALAEFIATKKSMHYPSELRSIFNNYIVQ